MEAESTVTKKCRKEKIRGGGERKKRCLDEAKLSGASSRKGISVYNDKCALLLIFLL